MSVPARLGAFAVVIALAFGGGAVLGAAIGPDVDQPAPTHDGPATSTPDAADHLIEGPQP